MPDARHRRHARRALLALVLVASGCSTNPTDASSGGDQPSEPTTPTTTPTTTTATTVPVTPTTEAPPAECVSAAEAAVSISDRYYSGDAVAVTEVGTGITSVELAIVEMGKKCGNEHYGWALSQLMLWANANGSANPEVASIVGDLCTLRDRIPALTESADALCDS